MSKKYNTKKKTLLGNYLKTNFEMLDKPTLKYSTVDSNWLENENNKSKAQRNQDLLKYSFFGDKRRVKIALNYENGADINCCDKNNNNALILSVYSRAEEVVKYLANYHKDEKGEVIDDITPINLNAVNKDGISALHLATKLKNAKIIKILLDAGANPNVQGKYNQTPIFESVNENDIKGITLLNDYKANINHQNREGFTPLIVACQNKFRQEALLSLIKLGANIKLKDNKQKTALMHAANNDNGAIMDIILKSTFYDKSFINAQDVNGTNALMICAKRGNREAVRALLSRGANPFIADKKGRDAVDYANFYANHTCAEIITKAKKIYIIAEQSFQNENDKTNYIQKEMEKIGKQNRVQNSCIK